MNYVVAVSGGVDSVVLLDIMARKQSQDGDRLIVAHVDHGIRQESADDERFVRCLAKQYRLPYLSKRLELGESASEELAREARYEFLLSAAEEHKAKLLTAHHQDDLIGSIMINLERGTGWRGLAVMNRRGVDRPLLGWTKQTIYEYAIKSQLEWVEDATNQSDKYLRNRLRGDVLHLSSKERLELVRLRSKQLQLGHDIDREIDRTLLKFADSRYSYGATPARVATELLRARFAITYPQADRLLIAIKTAQPGTYHVVNKQLKIRFTKTDFIVDSHL